MDKEACYIECFYRKNPGGVALSVGYGQTMSEIYSFVFKDSDGVSIGIVALGALSNGKKIIHIYHIGAFISHQGSGSKILREPCRHADRKNIILSVSAAAMTNGNYNEIGDAKLVQWYRSFDFTGNNRLLRFPLK